MYERQPEGEILNISMADGLSGTYNSACTAKNMVENPELAAQAEDRLRAHIADADIEILPLRPAFTTQGGPRCVAIQTIKKL